MELLKWLHAARPVESKCLEALRSQIDLQHLFFFKAEIFSVAAKLNVLACAAQVRLQVEGVNNVWRLQTRRTSCKNRFRNDLWTLSNFPLAWR